MNKKAILITGFIALSFILLGVSVLFFLGKKDNLTYNLTQELVNSASWRDLVLKSANNPNFQSSLTSQLSQAIVNNLVKNNPSGPQSAGGLTNALNVSSFGNDIYQSAGNYAAQFDQEKAQYLGQIKVSQNNSQIQQKIYLTELFAISDKYFSNISFGSQAAIDDLLKVDDSTKLDQIAAAYQQVLKESLALQVPSNLLDLHKKYIDFYATNVIAFQDIKEINDDPLRAAFAIQEYINAQVNFPITYATIIGWGDRVGAISLK